MCGPQRALSWLTVGKGALSVRGATASIDVMEGLFQTKLFFKLTVCGELWQVSLNKTKITSYSGKKGTFPGHWLGSENVNCNLLVLLVGKIMVRGKPPWAVDFQITWPEPALILLTSVALFLLDQMEQGQRVSNKQEINCHSSFPCQTLHWPSWSCFWVLGPVSFQEGLAWEMRIATAPTTFTPSHPTVLHQAIAIKKK